MKLKYLAIFSVLLGVSLAGQTGSKPTTTKTETVAKSEIVVDQVSFAIYDRNDAPSLTTLKANTKDSKVHTVDKSKKLQLKFTVKDAKKTEMLVQQAFLAFVHKDSEREAIFVAEPAAGTKEYVVDLEFGSQAKNFDGVNGSYSLRLILGDSNAANAIDWTFAEIYVSFSSVAHPSPKKSQVVNYDPLPEIHHKFREPEVRPSAVISDTFALICLAPLLFLLVSWLRIGINFGNIQFSLWALGFHVGLTAIFGLYFTFWLRLDMFETLKYLTIIGLPTFFCGNKLLQSLNQYRTETKKE